jgi:hypothetical protein
MLRSSKWGRAAQLGNPDARVVLEEPAELCHLLFQRVRLECMGSVLTTGDMERFVLKFWEHGFSSGWEPFIQNASNTTPYGGRSDAVFWEAGKGTLVAHPSAHNFPAPIMNRRRILGQQGLRVTQMRELPVTIYTGEVFGKNAATVVPHNPAHLPAIWCFCSSPEYHSEVRRMDQKLNVTIGTLVKIPFDLDYWTEVAKEKYPNGLPKPYSDDPTQWIFHGHPAQSEAPLQVAVARLLGYRWPAELDPEMELSDEARAWIKRSETLLPYADQDGIVCIPPLRGESSAADRLLDVLAAAYADDWSTDQLARLLADADHADQTLETWLRDKFFAQHCRLFQNRPFIWHIWDGLQDGFAALVNYHKLERKGLESLVYTYLGEWIGRQREAVANGIDGAEEKLIAAEELKCSLELILAGEAPYDIFVRWRPLEEQPIGWEPDLNDGVRLNIRPFMTVPDVRLKGAGVLRNRPNIKWSKDVCVRCLRVEPEGSE